MADTSTVLLCDPHDPFYSLATEIARVEAAPCFQDIEQALDANARFLLWIGSPPAFKDKSLAKFAIAHAQRHARTSPGIITGKTMEDARGVWQRGKSMAGGRVIAVIVGGSAPVGRGRLSTPSLVETVSKRNPDREDLRMLLANADYLTISAPGNAAAWRLSDGSKFTATDVPKLPAMVVSALNPVTPIDENDSIALAALRNGAAAFSGLLAAPVRGFFLGGADGLPLRYTWPGVTIGEVIQMQNLGEMKGPAAIACRILFGDPRACLQPDAVWTPLNIESVHGFRTVNFGETPPGFFPVRIHSGAPYRYYEIPGVAAASDDDVFFNARLQMMNTGPDKILLVVHPGGELKISMRYVPPRLWRWKRALLDAADATFIFVWAAWTRWASVLAGIAALGGIAALRRKGKPGKGVLRRAIAVGIGMAIAHMVYVLVRIGAVTMTSEPLSVGPVDILATALWVTLGTLVFMGAGSVVRKVAGTAVAAAPAIAAMIASTGMIAYLNFFSGRTHYGTGIYRYSLTWMTLIGTLCQCAAFLLLYLASRMLPGVRKSGPAAGRK